MLKKLVLSLLLGSVVAQPLMAVDLDTGKLAMCMQGAKVLDGEMFAKCIEAAKIPELKGFAKVASIVNNNAGAFVAGAALVSLAFMYCCVWPRMRIKIGGEIYYEKDSKRN